MDGIGGFNQYGQVDTVWNCRGLLPIRLADGVRLKKEIKQDEPIPMDAVELDETRLLTRLWREQERMWSMKGIILAGGSQRGFIR